MKLIEKTSLLILLPALLACTVEDPKDSTPKAKSYNYFSASASAAEVGADGGTVFLLVNSNVPWQISADRGLAPDVREGSGNGFVNITVSENPSFDTRSFSYSVSTEEELDVDDPEQWTVFGRKLDFRLVQAGMEKKFQVDKALFDLPASSVSASLVLTTNLDYQIRLAEEGLVFETVDDGPLRHLINFSFPANRNPETVTYHAEIVPEDESLQPIQIVITQAAFKILVLEFTNAANFRYVNAAGDTLSLPARTNSIYPTLQAVDFWLKGKEEYVFNGAVANWAKTLSAARNTPVKLPSVDGYVLGEVDVTYSYSTSSRTYSVVDSEGKVLGSCSRTRADSDSGTVTKIDLTGLVAVGTELSLVCNSEMCVQFILTYAGI